MSLQNLYRKIQEFEALQRPELMSLSQCRKGCSRCCHVDIGVFQIEADNIREWFDCLSPETQQKVRAKWDSPAAADACAFLRDDACTIYEGRPLICRTQGLALMFTQDGEQFADICPLNEELLNLATSGEFLNLDLVNLILSRLEQEVAGTQVRKRVRLAELCQELKGE